MAEIWLVYVKFSQVRAVKISGKDVKWWGKHETFAKGVFFGAPCIIEYDTFYIFYILFLYNSFVSHYIYIYYIKYNSKNI